jgi:2-oxoglutarate decarboxylase
MLSSSNPGNTQADFGANEWLVAEMYSQWLENPDSVDRSWIPILERYQQTQAGATVTPSAPPAQPATANTEAITMPIAKATDTGSFSAPVPANLPATASMPIVVQEEEAQPEVNILRGMAKTLASNMDASLSVPTATSVRQLPAKVLIDNRIVVNSHLKRTRGGKVSFTHLIGYAVVQALKEFPSQNVYYDEIDGKPAAITPPHVNLGLAIDIPKPDGTRALLVPNIKKAQKLNFAEFLSAYDDLVARARDNKLAADDFAGTTISLTNPGGIGTVHSVPRLTKGQGCIVGVGALEYPAQFKGLSEEQLAEQGIGKVLTLTSTYDHRVIQGAGSGEFLKIVEELLLGERDFYVKIFADMRIPYTPVVWVNDFHWDLADQSGKNTRIQEYINAFRERGHLIADIDPLEYVQRWHPDLDIRNYGLSLWDLDRTFKTGGFGGRAKAKFRNMLGILRDTYCRTVGVEYMHIADPDERKWFQDTLEQPYRKPSKEEQFRILAKLNEAEAFEKRVPDSGA